MDRFRFHLTLTGPSPETGMSAMATALRYLLKPLCALRFVIDQVGLAGEGPDGMFRLIRHFQLRG